MTWSSIIAIVIALALVYATFIYKTRPAWIQIVVIIVILAGGYYMFFMEPTLTVEQQGARSFYGSMIGGGSGGY